LIEVLITVLIIHAIAGMIMVNVSNIQTSEKITRGAQQVIVALRYARMVAMTTGQPAGVEFNTATNQVRVFQGAAATTVPNSLIPGGNYIIDFNSQFDVNGTRITAATIVGDTTSPYQVIFGKLGGTNNNGSVTLTYASQSKTISIPVVGDATMQ